MFNITGLYCKVWKVEDKGNYVSVDLTTSKKQKDGSYTNSKYFGVKFVGRCLDEAKQIQEGDKVDILNGLIGKRKGKDDKYYDDVVIFQFEQSEGQKKVAPVETTDIDSFQEIEDSDDIPFTVGWAGGSEMTR